MLGDLRAPFHAIEPELVWGLFTRGIGLHSERLAALGYVAGSTADRPADPGALPDPTDVMGSLRLVVDLP